MMFAGNAVREQEEPEALQVVVLGSKMQPATGVVAQFVPAGISSLKSPILSFRLATDWYAGTVVEL